MNCMEKLIISICMIGSIVSKNEFLLRSVEDNSHLNEDPSKIDINLSSYGRNLCEVILSYARRSFSEKEQLLP